MIKSLRLEMKSLKGSESSILNELGYIPDMEQFKLFMGSDEIKKAMEEDGLKIETLRILNESTV
jgi:hypothetical protein